MTNEQQNLQVVQQLFAAFGRADLPAALSTLGENVDFQSPVTRNAPAQISWAKPRHSREEVAAFFKELAEKMQIERMEALEYTAQSGRVVVEGRNRGIVRATGRTYEHDWVMVFTLQDGKIIRHRHYYDTADILAAFRSN
ncbi:MAG: hypothetical protein A2Y72_06400 [Chloroflexi bacterium RBG_13_53_26]|nr:MAG: hypothetical protein A2Y72_06400 [Chloroflexi bacterium RBG_13_53_26]